MIYKVTWEETNRASAIVEAGSAKEAIDIVKQGVIVEQMGTDWYGPKHEDSFEAEATSLE